MTHASRLIAAAALVALAASSPTDALTLRQTVVATTDVVTVGDFFRDAGDAADKPLFKAPAPGTTGGVGALRLSDALRAIGVDWTPRDPGRRIVVTRRAATPRAVIEPGEVAAAITEAIAGSLTEVGGAEDLVVTLNGRTAPLALPAAGAYDLSVQQIDIDRRNRRFEAVIAIDQADHREERRAAGSYQIQMPVPVLALPVARGEVVSESHIVFERIARPGPQVLTSAAEIVGQAARRPLRTGQTLRAADLEPPRVVSRNELVTIVFELPGMLLTTQGRALADAAAGEPVSVLNVRSNRIVQAVARNHGQVSVGASATQLAMR